MVRYAAIALLALVPLSTGIAQAGKDKKEKKVLLKVEGKLTNDDPKDRKRNAASKVYTVKFKKGVAYQIDLMSRQFDAYLRLEDKNGNELAEDDDGGGMLNSRIIFNCQRDDDYKVYATALNPGGIGMYTLIVKEQGTAAKSTSAHTVLIDKTAPDFQGDFAINGKPVKLSSLKGKVVLLGFWDVRSHACESTLPKLSKWQQEYKKAGLKIVGVTFYKVDIGQSFVFDSTNGKLKRVAKATRKTEQAMLKYFAAFHKVKHLLMTMPKEDALKTFDAYGVNGFPQFVLIDRNGMVRYICVGENETTMTALEGEIKKLVAPK